MQECYQSLLSITATYSRAHRVCAKIRPAASFQGALRQNGAFWQN